jgi:hypothetical protein
MMNDKKNTVVSSTALSILNFKYVLILEAIVMIMKLVMFRVVD